MMVSTRGGARTSAAVDPKETDNTLGKKPVRRTTAKAAASASTTKTTATKAKTTRSKKTEPEVEENDYDELQDVEPEEATAPAPAPAKPTRKPTTRVKKDAEPAKAPKATRATKATSATATTASRAAKTKPAEEKLKSKAEQKVPELKPAQPRATRATRATASKAAPLSPKKITQVAKVPVKTTRAADAKTVPSQAIPTKPAPRGRPPNRRRNVSDENVDISSVAPSIQDLEEGKDIQVSTVRATCNRKLADESADSTDVEPEVDDTVETTDVTEDHTQQTESDEEEENEESEQVSADELAGPKTPMKRPSFREAKKFASTRKSNRELDVDAPMKTPVRRLAVLGTQQGTPQTQKSSAKKAALVEDTDESTIVQDEGTPMPETTESGDRDEIVSVSESEDPDLSLLVDPENRNMELTAEDAAECPPQEADSNMMESTTGETEDTSAVASGAASIIDPDETIVDEAMGEKNNTEPEDSSLGSVNSVIITRSNIDITQDFDVDDIMEAFQPTDTTPQPETLVWENIRQDVSIPFNFDAPASPSREIPAANTLPELSEPDAIAGATEQTEVSGVPSDLGLLDPGNASGLSSRDQTVRLSDFVDMASLSDHRQTIQLQSEAGTVAAAAKPAAVEDEVENDDSVVEGEVTLLCAEPPTPRTVKRSPIKLTTVEHADEDESIVEGDITLFLGQPACPATVKRSPVKLTTMEDVEDDDQSVVEGDITLALGQPSYPPTIKRSPIKLANMEDVDDDDESVVDGDVTLALDQPQCPPTMKCSPFKLSTAEDFPELDPAIEGDMTLNLDNISIEMPATPTLVNEARVSDVTSLDLQGVASFGTPHYTLPTIASRRKSFSSSHLADPIQDRVRPKTSDCTINPAMANPFAGAWFDTVRSPVKGRSARSRPSSAFQARSPSRARNPVAMTPISKVLRLSNTASAQQLAERMPGLPCRETYEELLGSPAAKSPMVRAPIAASSAGAERDPGLPSRENYDEDVAGTPAKQRPAKTPAVKTRVTRSKTPRVHALEPATFVTPPPAQEERYPGLPAKRSYEAHAHTAMPQTRFRTPERLPMKRPATAQKPASLRKVALKASTSNASRTPIRSPLKASAETPGQAPMTPHPAAPLKGVVAVVDVYTSDGGCATGPFTQLLQRLGAKTTKTFSDRVTHVVYKDGSNKVVQALIIHNKQVTESGVGTQVFCVNSRWVNDCDSNGKRMPETDVDYAVDIDDAPRTAKRRRKSMEPMSLLNNGGNIIRDRKSSLGRVSIGRLSSLNSDSPSSEMDVTTKFSIADKENSGDSEIGSSPATPAYLAAPSSIHQKTAPVNKVRKLDFNASHEAKKNRRLTFADMEF